MEADTPIPHEFVPISDDVLSEVSRLVTEALPIECYAHLFGRPSSRRWTVDRVMERLALGDGATHTLEVLVAEERQKCPTGWQSGKPAFRSARDYPNGTFSPPTNPYGYWEFTPRGMFVQTEDGNWIYRRRTEEREQGDAPSWMVEFIRYTLPGESSA